MDAGVFIAWLRKSRPALYGRCLEKEIIPEQYRAKD